MIEMSLTAPYTLEKRTYPDPSPGKAEVLIRILQTGICGSDMLAYRGLHKYVNLPLVLGHECVAQAAAVGKDVEHIKVGDLVTVQPQLTCGKCYACMHGSPNVCAAKQFMGINIKGFFSDYAVVPAWNVIKLPKGFTADMGMVVEPFAVGANAVDKANIRPGMRVVVLGAGTIGNCVAQMAKASGAKVLITDIQQEKLALAKSAGIPHAQNISGTRLKEAIANAFNSDGADVIIDCCAVPQLFNEAIACAENASTVIMVGTFEKDVTVDLTQLQRREIQLLSVMQYVRKHFLAAIAALENKHVDITQFIGARFQLEKLSEGFRHIEQNSNTILKAAIHMNAI